MIKEIIYNTQNLKDLIRNKANIGAYYLIYNNGGFEYINPYINFNRDFYLQAKKAIKPLNVIKYIDFNLNNVYETNEIYEFIDLLRKKTVVLATWYDPRIRNCTILFIGNKYDTDLEKNIKDFIEMDQERYE